MTIQLHRKAYKFSRNKTCYNYYIKTAGAEDIQVGVVSGADRNSRSCFRFKGLRNYDNSNYGSRMDAR